MCVVELSQRVTIPGGGGSGTSIVRKPGEYLGLIAMPGQSTTCWMIARLLTAPWFAGTLLERSERASRAAYPCAGSGGVDASRERCLGPTPPSVVVDDELHKILVAVAYDDVFDCVWGRFSWPDSLASRPVAFQAYP